MPLATIAPQGSHLPTELLSITTILEPNEQALDFRLFFKAAELALLGDLHTLNSSKIPCRRPRLETYCKA